MQTGRENKNHTQQNKLHIMEYPTPYLQNYNILGFEKEPHGGNPENLSINVSKTINIRMKNIYNIHLTQNHQHL